LTSFAVEKLLAAMTGFEVGLLWAYVDSTLDAEHASAYHGNAAPATAVPASGRRWSMTHLLIALTIFVCVFASAMLGLHVRTRLPEHHLSEESTNTIKLATGLVATIAALVLGLLTSSAKNSFDTVSADLVRNAVTVLQLDRELAQYGPEAHDLRVSLKQNYAIWVDLLTSGNSTELARLESPEILAHLEDFQRKLTQLSPTTAIQRQMQARALDIADSVFAARSLALLQKRGSLPTLLLIVLVSWLTVIFGTFGLFAPRNATVIFFFLVCALSAAGAIFVILEMDTPLDGIVRVSPAPLQEALQELGK
jgi:hypothetical protein